jgi:hypothetical protein
MNEIKYFSFYLTRWGQDFGDNEAGEQDEIIFTRKKELLERTTKRIIKKYTPKETLRKEHSKNYRTRKGTIK